MTVKRYAIVGTGGRGLGSFIEPLIKEYPDDIKYVGFMDPNMERAKACAEFAKQPNMPIFDNFDKMVAETKPEAIIVCGVDSTHAEYIFLALNANIDVFSEKPICTTHDQVQAIRKAQANSKATAFVTHNLRFNPNLVKMKQLIMDGDIGDVLHIQYDEVLDRAHGADYFRRWHGKMENSGGLLIHKSSHHFDIMNWFINAKPSTMTAHGNQLFYGKKGKQRGERCTTCEHSKTCELYANPFENDRIKALYQDVEHVDGYHRDGCVFDEAIDIMDTANLNFTYENGAEACYALVSYGSFEGMRILVQGTKGRLEYETVHSTSWAVGGSKKDAGTGNDGSDASDREQLNLFRFRAADECLTQPKMEGGHGGSDPMLRKFLFGPEEISDPLGQKATLEEGMQAVLVGLAANKSIAENSIRVDVQSMEQK